MSDRRLGDYCKTRLGYVGFRRHVDFEQAAVSSTSDSIILNSIILFYTILYILEKSLFRFNFTHPSV